MCLVHNREMVQGLWVERPDRDARDRGDPNASRSLRARSRVRRHADAIIQTEVGRLTQALKPGSGDRPAEPRAGHKIA